MSEHQNPRSSSNFDVRRNLSRRTLLQSAVVGIGAATAASLLAACGGSSSSTPTPTTAGPASTATSAPTTAGAATSTTAAQPTSSSATSATTPSGTTGGQVSVLWNKPVTLHPLFSHSGNEQQVERLMFGSLVKMSDKLVPTPDLAEKIDVSPDATTYTFHLQHGITFNDGQPLTSSDVVFTFERAVDKRTGSVWAGRLSGIAGASEYADQKSNSMSGLEAPDDTTVKITLADPDAAFLPNLCSFSGLGILPEHVLKDVAPDQMAKNDFALNPTVTAGAFQFVKYATDQYLQMKRNDKYVGKAPALDQIFLKILTPDVALAQLEKGDLDLMTLAVEAIDEVKKMSSLTVVSVPSPSISQIGIFNDRPYFQDKRVRQAMMYAIDREGIVKDILAGEAQVVNSPIIGPDWMGIPDVNQYAYDPNKAKQLLKDANWDTSRKVPMIYSGVSKEQQAYAPIIQQQLKEAGIQVDLQQVDNAVISKKYVTEPDYDLFLFGGGVYRADPSISATYYASWNKTPAGGNGTHYSNPQLDDLFKQGIATNDPAARKKIYQQIATIINEDVPTVFLWSPNSIYAFNKRLVGFQPPSYIDNKLWNTEAWSVTS